jgi:hypothetical protein
MHHSSWLFFAYIDPGGGAFFIQILLGGIFAWLYRFRRAVLTFFRDREAAKTKTAKL